MQAITLQALSQYTGGPAPAPVAYNYEVPKMKPKAWPPATCSSIDPLQFWSIFSAAMNENPPPASRDRSGAAVSSSISVSNSASSGSRKT